MENQEESEMLQDFGGIARALMGSSMQLAEHAQRRAQVNLAEANAAVERERSLAHSVHRDFSSPQFWKNAGSEAIADRMIVASELAGMHEVASQAFMAGADRIRNQFGINVEDINRDHPTAATDRHRALRDALDDYLAGQRENVEGNPVEAKQAQEREAAHRTETERAEGEERLDKAHAAAAELTQDPRFNIFDFSSGRDGTTHVDKDRALSILEDLPADTVPDRAVAGRDEISFVPSWYGKDDDVDRAIAAKFPHLVPGGAPLPPEKVDAATVAETQDQGSPDQSEGTNPGSAETPHEPSNPAGQRLLAVWKDKGGKDADFPHSPTTRNPQTAMKNRQRVMAGVAPSRTRGQELSR